MGYCGKVNRERESGLCGAKGGGMNRKIDRSKVTVMSDVYILLKNELGTFALVQVSLA